MKEFSNKEIQIAKAYWYEHYNQKSADQNLVPFLNNEIKGYSANNESWLERARLGLFLSTQTVADQLKMTRSGYSLFEEHERKGSITLSSLAKAAEAMDCELVYAIRPKNKKIFSENIWTRIFDSIKNHPWLSKCDQRRRGSALANLAKENMRDPQFKRDQNWSPRANQPLSHTKSKHTHTLLSYKPSKYDHDHEVDCAKTRYSRQVF